MKSKVRVALIVASIAMATCNALTAGYCVYKQDWHMVIANAACAVVNAGVAARLIYANQLA